MTEHDAAADLAYIRQVMQDTRRYTAAKGGYFIVWGVVISLGLFLTWLQLHGHWQGSNFLAWTVCILIGWAGTAWLVWRERQDAVVPLMARQIGYNWMAVGLAMSILYFVGVPSGSLSPKLLPALSAALVGVGMFNTGSLAGLDWLRAVAGGWWLGAIYMLMHPGPGTLLVMAVLLIGLQIVPGVLLVREARGRG